MTRTKSTSGFGWVNELLSGHQTCFYDNLGMNWHVFCQLKQAHDPDDEPTPDEEQHMPVDSFGELQHHISGTERTQAAKWQDDIAQAMWDDYKQYRVQQQRL